MIAHRKLKDENNNERYNGIQNSLNGQSLKLKMKWQTVKHLVKFKNVVIEKLIFNTIKLLKESKSSEETLYFNKESFSKLLNENGVSNDVHFINKIFWIFDDMNSGEIDFKDFVFCFELFNDAPLEKRITRKSN